MVIELNSQFKEFVSFAVNSSSTAIAGVTDNDKAMATREVKARTGDFVGNVGRKFFSKSAEVNDNTRAVFMKSIADIFGGKDLIPPSVKEAMQMKDYDCGKPLTARRIIKVRDAIQNLGLLEDVKAQEIAMEHGYGEADFPRLNTATKHYAQHAGRSLQDAFAEVLKEGTPANTVMRLGSLYLKDADTFSRGVDAHSVESRAEKLTKISEESRTGSPTAGLYAFQGLRLMFSAVRSDVKEALKMYKVDTEKECVKNMRASFEQLDKDLTDMYDALKKACKDNIKNPAGNRTLLSGTLESIKKVVNGVMDVNSGIADIAKELDENAQDGRMSLRMIQRDLMRSYLEYVKALESNLKAL